MLYWHPLRVWFHVRLEHSIKRLELGSCRIPPPILGVIPSSPKNGADWERRLSPFITLGPVIQMMAVREINVKHATRINAKIYQLGWKSCDKYFWYIYRNSFPFVLITKAFKLKTPPTARWRYVLVRPRSAASFGRRRSLAVVKLRQLFLIYILSCPLVSGWGRARTYYIL